MKLSEFVLQPRGPYLFDHYIHPIPIPSPLGHFSLEFHVNNAAKHPPDEKMLRVIVALKNEFVTDIDSLVALVHQQYLLAAEDQDWCEGFDVPTGLTENELEPLLHARTITVSKDETDSDEPNPGRIYMSPDWDVEHGLYYARIDGKWVQVDC